MLTTRSQRWRDRRCHWVPGATEIDPRRFGVDIIDTVKQAAPFVRQHHYAASMPVTRLSVGLFRNGAGGRSDLVGVCVFAHPVNNASVPKSAGLSDARSACDLGRLVLLDDTGGNAETWMLSRAFKLLRREKPEIVSVISYADPIRRIDEQGQVFMPGHVGTLYCVMGSRYTGRSSARIDLILPNGQPISSRTTNAANAMPPSNSPPPVPGPVARARMERTGSPISNAPASCAVKSTQATMSICSRSPKQRG